MKPLARLRPFIRGMSAWLAAAGLLAPPVTAGAASSEPDRWIAPPPSFMARTGVACFYAQPKHAGHFQCLHPGPQLSTLPERMDNAISSMWIPPNMRAWVFDEQWGDGRAAVFTGDVDIDALRAQGMQGRIRSLQLAWATPNCLEGCKIQSGEAYDLPALFGPAWTTRQPKQVLLAFDLNAGKVFRVDHGDNVQLVFNERHASLISGAPKRILTHLRYSPETRYVILAMSLTPDHSNEVQLIESDVQRRYLRSSPIVSLPWPEKFGALMSIKVPDVVANRTSPRLTSAIFRLGDSGVSPRRSRRSLGCDSASELISVVNFFLGLCASSSHPALAPAPSEAPAPFRLVRVYGAGRNPMAMMGAARACRIPLDYALAPRMKRDTVPSLACLSRATLIITLYQALFPRQWDLARFTRVIDRVLTDGHLGEPLANARDAATFVSAVRQQTSTIDTRRADAINAFHGANAALGTLGMWSPATSSARCTAADMAGGVSAAAHARTAATGLYELDLADHVPQAAVARVRHGGTWIASETPFTHTIVDTDDVDALRQIIDTTARWHASYLAHEQMLPLTAATDCAERERRRLAFTATSIAHNIHGDAHGGTSDGTIFIVVRHGDTIVSILQAQRQDHSMRIVDTLSAPDNVLVPEAEGALRGAGAYALQQLFAYSQARGVQTVTSEAVTEPSALLKVQAGFRRTGDL